MAARGASIPRAKKTRRLVFDGAEFPQKLGDKGHSRVFHAEFSTM